MATVASVTRSAEQRIILHDVSWATYESLLFDHFERNSPRFTYDRGLLEIMTTSGEHEERNRTLALLVEVVAEEQGIDVRNLGQMTFKREDISQGFEPDTCFYIGSEPHIRATLEFDPSSDAPPDLVIEIDISKSSLNRLPIYAGFGVPEVWRYRSGRVLISRLELGDYVESEESVALPPLTGEIVSRFLAESQSMRRTEWLRSVRSWIREQATT